MKWIITIIILMLLSLNATATTPVPPIGRFSGFESGKILSTLNGGIWKSCGTIFHRFICGHIKSQTTIVRSGTFAANITVHPGDIASGNGTDATERAELDSGKYATMGLDLFYGWSLQLPFNFEQQDKRLVLAQWKQAGTSTGGLSPPLSMRYRSGNWTIVQRLDDYERNGTQTEFQLPHLPLGSWNDLVFHVRFSTKKDGIVGMWVNGTKVVDYTGQTALTNGTDVFYNKLGLYRDRSPTSNVWYALVDNYEVGSSFANVDPATFSERHP